MGTQAIKLTLDGFKAYVQSVEVEEGQTVEIKAVLAPAAVLEPEMVYIPGGTARFLTMDLFDLGYEAGSFDFAFHQQSRSPV